MQSFDLYEFELGLFCWSDSSVKKMSSFEFDDIVGC